MNWVFLSLTIEFSGSLSSTINQINVSSIKIIILDVIVKKIT